MQREKKTNEGIKKIKGKMKMLRVGGHKGFSIHLGPGELVHRGHHPLEAQSLPGNQKKKKKILFTFKSKCLHKNVPAHQRGTSFIITWFPP